MSFDVLRDRRVLLGLTLVATAAVIAACGSSSPMSPSTAPSVATFTITGAGVSPKEMRIQVGDRVRFVNNDTVNRQINSDPYPGHGNCPPTNDVDVMTPGQSKMTGVFSFEGTCGFHEHLTEGAQEFLGTILVGNTASVSDDPPGEY